VDIMFLFAQYCGVHTRKTRYVKHFKLTINIDFQCVRRGLGWFF
jgi:hypothetical protein